MRRGRKEKQEEPGGMLSRKMLSDARVIAKEERIRDVQRLVTQDGGRASRWVKKSSPQFEVAGARFDYDWSEHQGVGRFETRHVRVNEAWSSS